MACPLFFERRGCRCGAVRGRHVPTVFERERYCRSAYEECPTRSAHLACGRLLTDDEYLEIWLPEITAPGA